MDRQNFDSVLAGVAPTLEIAVDDVIASDGAEVQVRLAFRSLDDFEPARLLSQVNHLRRLTEIRAKLDVVQELQVKLPELALLLEETLSVTRNSQGCGLCLAPCEPAQQDVL